MSAATTKDAILNQKKYEEIQQSAIHEKNKKAKEEAKIEKEKEEEERILQTAKTRQIVNNTIKKHFTIEIAHTTS